MQFGNAFSVTVDSQKIYIYLKKRPFLAEQITCFYCFDTNRRPWQSAITKLNITNKEHVLCWLVDDLPPSLFLMNFFFSFSIMLAKWRKRNQIFHRMWRPVWIGHMTPHSLLLPLHTASVRSDSNTCKGRFTVVYLYTHHYCQVHTHTQKCFALFVFTLYAYIFFFHKANGRSLWLAEFDWDHA